MSDSGALQKAITNAKARISEKQELLRQLNMVKAHRNKNNEEPIDNLVAQWRSGAQEALMDLQKHMPEPKPTLKEILANLQIEHPLVGYHEEDDCFV